MRGCFDTCIGDIYIISPRHKRLLQLHVNRWYYIGIIDARFECAAISTASTVKYEDHNQNHSDKTRISQNVWRDVSPLLEDDLSVVILLHVRESQGQGCRPPHDLTRSAPRQSRFKSLPCSHYRDTEDVGAQGKI